MVVLKNRKGILFALISTVLCVVLLASIVVSVVGTAPVKKGVVTTSPGFPLNVRADAGVVYTIIGSLNSGDIAVVVGEKNASDGVLWYCIEYNSTVGYVSSQYFEILPDETTGGEPTPPYTPSVDFEEYLTQQNFPESYKVELRKLHEIYPNWVFKAQHINFDFNYAVEKEQPLSLIWHNSPSSWKSTDTRDYIWESDQWVYYEPNWNRASSEIVAYFMDPRNFLGVNTVFQFLEQSFDENIQSVDGVKQIISGTFMENDITDTDETTLNYATAIYNAGKNAGANPYVLAAMMKLELGEGTNPMITGTYSGYEGYFNYFNINAYGSTNDDIIRNGLWYARGGNETDPTKLTYQRPWNTRLKAIYGGAEFYADGYINRGQNTLYLKKFNVQGNNPFTHQYMTNAQGASQEAVSLSQGYSNEMRASALSFIIPVYKSMPDNAVAQPTATGSPNMKLSALSVDNFSFTPEFAPDVLEYMIVVPPTVNTINISATPMQNKAIVSGIGVLPLNEDKQTFDVVVTAENGAVRTYKITIAKENSESFGKVAFSDSFLVKDDIVSRISPNTTVGALKNALMTQGSVVVKSASGVLKDDGAIVSTGDILQVYSTTNMPYGELRAAVKGDIDEDGEITISDMIKVRNVILGTGSGSQRQLLGADVDGDGEVSISDMIKIRNHILGTILIP